MTNKRREDEAVDAMSEDSFPASDPPSTTPPAGSRAAGSGVRDAGRGASRDRPGAAGLAGPSPGRADLRTFKPCSNRVKS